MKLHEKLTLGWIFTGISWILCLVFPFFLLILAVLDFVPAPGILKFGISTFALVALVVSAIIRTGLSLQAFLFRALLASGLAWILCVYSVLFICIVVWPHPTESCSFVDIGSFIFFHAVGFCFLAASFMFFLATRKR